MKFSSAKKETIQDPQALRLYIEKHLDEIQALLQNAQTEKAELHALLESAGKERQVIRFS